MFCCFGGRSGVFQGLVLFGLGFLLFVGVCFGGFFGWDGVFWRVFCLVFFVVLGGFVVVCFGGLLACRICLFGGFCLVWFGFCLVV